MDFHAKLNDKDQDAYDFWYDDIDQKICSFKYYIHNYIQGNEAHLHKYLGSQENPVDHVYPVLSLVHQDGQRKRK